MELFYTLILFYAMLELFEIYWQKSDTLMGMMLRLYQRYRKSILWFLILHPTYYFAIYLTMITDYAVAALVLLFVKTVDIATKILLIQQIFEKRELTEDLTAVLLMPLHPLLSYISLVVYVPMVVLALF